MPLSADGRAEHEAPIPAAVAADGMGEVAQIRGSTSVLSDFAAMLGSRLGAAILAFGTVFLTTRMLVPAAYGTVATTYVVANLMYNATAAWTGSAVRRYGREELADGQSMSRLTWGRVAICGPLLVLTICITLGLKAAGILPADMTWSLVLLSVASAVGQIVLDHWSCVLETAGRIKLSAAAQMLRQAIYVVMLAGVFVIARHSTATVVVTLSSVSLAVIVLGLLPWLWRLAIRPVGTTRALARRMLWLSAPLIGLTASQYVIGSIDLVVLRAFRTRADVGVYSVAYQAYSVLLAAAMAAPAVFVPLFVSLQMASRKDLIARYVRRTIPQILLVVAVLMGFGVSLLRVLVPVVFGHSFTAASKPLAFLCIGITMLFGANLVAPIMLLYEKTRVNAAIAGIAAAMNVAGDLLSIAVLHTGIEGPAISTSIAITWVFAADYVVASRCLGIRPRFDPTVMLPFAAALAVSRLMGGFTGMLAAAAATLLATGVVIVWRRPFRAEDAEVLAKLDLPGPVKRWAMRALELFARI
jgi:O-antigen/teichoic acid export membrane protein